MQLPVSLPPRGAWIEIDKVMEYAENAYSRSPHGERGLKYRLIAETFIPNPSLPPRGAWIEILGLPIGEKLDRSLPPRGAWIEITWLGFDCFFS